MIVSEALCEMPAAHPPEFRRRALDLVAQGNPVGETARDLGISESCLRNWMSRDAIDSGRKPGLTTDEHRELLIQRAQRFCMPSDEKDWLAFTEVMKQDLRGQIFLR